MFQRSCTSFLTCLPDTIETILGLGGVVAVAGIIWGIYNYLISKGNQDRIEKGRHSIVASLGLFGALILSHAVFSFFRRILGI